MIRRLQRNFIAAAMLSLLVVLVTLIGLINGLNLYRTVSETDSTLKMLRETGGFSGPDEPPAGTQTPDAPFDRRGFSGEMLFQSRWFSVTLDGSGEAVAFDLKNIATVDEQTAAQMAQKAQARGREKGFLNSYRYLKTESNGQTQWIFLNCEREFGTFRNFLLVSCLISLGGYLAVFLLMALLSRRIVRPIAQSYEKQKQFITDAGHELKTPITIIRADTDVLEADVKDNEWIADIRAQTTRLASLTDDLIYLSRMEEASTGLMMIDFPLSDVVRETAQSFAAAAKAQDKTLTVSVQPMLTLNGDEKAIRKLVNVLLDNALKYSGEKGEIELSLIRSGKTIKLSVGNTAELSEEKGSMDRLFDRFYRADASRNSETGGFGLGLSVAKAVTEAHKGRIHAESPDGHSLVVEATFPD